MTKSKNKGADKHMMPGGHMMSDKAMKKAVKGKKY